MQKNIHPSLIEKPMSQSNRILQTAQIQWRQNLPVAQAFDDVYFSTEDGIAESHYVFFEHNKIGQRFSEFVNRQVPCSKTAANAWQFSDIAVFRIAETGFGSALNFLLTAQQWCESYQAKMVQHSLLESGEYLPVQLHYISVEKFPMCRADLQRVFSDFPTLEPFLMELLENYPPLLPGWHDVYLFDGLIRLTLWFGDAISGLEQCEAAFKVDAWYLDGFTPSKNPEMWQPKLFQQMARLSRQGTTFATFTAASAVRKGLQKVGFDVQKDSGYGLKREMCFGHLLQERTNASKTPWFERNSVNYALNGLSLKQAVIIGSGLAGATTAFALAEAGWQVRVLEKHSHSAMEASGNLAGTLHPLVTVDWSLRSQFYQLGNQVSQRWLRPWLEQGLVQGSVQGMLQLAATPTMVERLAQAKHRVPLEEGYAQWLSPEQATVKLGASTKHWAMFYPEGGWVYPKSVVEHCLNHPNIDVTYNCELFDFARIESSWQLQTSQGHIEAPVLILATGALAEPLNQTLQLPIRPVKGQVTHLAESVVKLPLNYPMTHLGYTSPTSSGQWVTGATFEAPNMTNEMAWNGHYKNVENSLQAVPDWLTKSKASEFEGLAVIDGRVGFRPTTPDHLPVIGAVPDWQWVQENYCQQSHTHAVYRYSKMAYQPGLYVNNGHGPRGLMSVFLAAEWLLAEVENRCLPVPQKLLAACHPARFKIRQWRSGKGCEGTSGSNKGSIK